MTTNDPTTNDETHLDSYTLDHPDGYVIDVALYRDPEFRFGPYIITADVAERNDSDVKGEAWTSTNEKKHITGRTKKVISEALGRAVLNIPPWGQDDSEESEFRQALQDIEQKK